MTTQKLAIFGPLPPPHTGMETITETILLHLGRIAPVVGLRYRHVDIAVNRSLSSRKEIRAMKFVLLFRQLARGAFLALRGYDAYYPISQDRLSLLRDLALLLPFRLTRRTVTIHLHGGSLREVLREEPSWVSSAIRVVVDRRRTNGIVLTPSLRQCLEPLVDRPRIRVVANAVEAPPPANRPRERPGNLQLLFLSTLMPAKGYRELVRAVSGLAQEGVAVRLELCGEPMTDEDDEWIASYASDPAVDFRGPVAGPRKWNALGRADVLALPSTVPEGQPLAILEGMAAGCAILTTAQGGIVDTVGDAEGAVLGSLEGEPLEAEIRRALLRWSEHPAEVARAGLEARIRFERFHSPDRFIREWLHAAWRDYVPSSAANGQGAID